MCHHLRPRFFWKCLNSDRSRLFGMPSLRGSTRSSPPAAGAARRGSRSQQKQNRNAGGQGGAPAGCGSGIATVVLGVLLLGGVFTILARPVTFSSGGMGGRSVDAPLCPAPLNRWADQRLALIREQLQNQHGLHRGEPSAPNAIVAAMNWIDDRILERRLDEDRQLIRSKLLKSSRCLVEFQP